MSIKFLCPHCKKVLAVKDENAGKKGKCPHCTKVLTVPSPARPSPTAAPAAPKPTLPPAAPKIAPPPSQTELEAEAAAALADEPKVEAPVESSTIDFNCPMCDASLHMPLSEASKRVPCPECKRIIKVPEPVKRDPTNWRQAAPNLPSGAKRAEEKAPEGAWGSATAAATVSREALHEAGAVPQVKATVPLTRRIIRITALAGGGVLFVVLVVFGYLKWLDEREAQGVQAALDYAAKEPGKTDLGAEGRAALFRLAGEYFLRAHQADSAKRARELFLKSLSAAEATNGAAEHDALLQDLTWAEVELGGGQTDVDAGLKAPWDDVHKQMQAALGAIRNPEARLQALRDAARRLAAQGQDERAASLATALYSSADEEKAAALGAVGLELAAAGKKKTAESVETPVDKLYGDKNRPALAPAAVALALVVGKDPPEPAKKPSKWVNEDLNSDALGRLEAQARMGQWEAARSAAQGLPTPELQLRAYAALAEAALDDKKAGTADIAEALKRAQPSASSWLLLRLVRIGARQGLAPDALQPVAAMIADRDLRGRAQLAVFQAQLAQAKQAVDLKAVDTVEAQTPSARLAREAWARRYGSAGVIRGWDAPNRAFGQVGIALGPQGDD